MKTAFALLVLGLICGAASDKCIKDECTGEIRTACFMWKGANKHSETEEALEEECRLGFAEYDCLKDFYERCYDEEYDSRFFTNNFTRESGEIKKRFFDRVCDENDLKQDYLEQAACINENKRPLRAQCQEKIMKEDHVKRLRARLIIQCEGEELINMCGRDNPEVMKLWYEFQLTLYFS